MAYKYETRSRGIYGDESEANWMREQQNFPRLNATGRSKESAWSQIRTRFGFFEIFTFVVGIIGILVPTALLALMWAWGVGTESSLSSNALTKLALRDRLPQFITIMTAILRFAIGIHTATCCMILASLALKRRAIIDPKDRHLITILQEVGSGPSTMALPFLRAAVHWRFVRGFSSICALLAVSTVCQFASTILLSDFQPTHLLAEPRHLALNMSTGNFDFDNDIAKAGRPVDYPHFAERMEGRNEIFPRGDDHGLFDTGNTSRAYFPLSAEARVRLQDYIGFATVLTTHTICFPPDVSNITIVDLYRTSNQDREQKGNDSSWSAEFAFTGTIPPPKSPLYSQYSGDRSFNFNRLPRDNFSSFVADACPSFSYFGINICSLQNYPWNVNPTYDNTGDIDDAEVEWFLVTRMAVSQEAQARNLTRLLKNGPTIGFEGSEWTALNFSDDTFSMVLHHSLCASRTLYTWANVSATSSKNSPIIPEEPFPARRLNTHNSADIGYDLDGIMMQFGVDSPNVRGAKARHGILKLEDDQDLRNRTGYENATISLSDVINLGSERGPDVCIPNRQSRSRDPKVYYYNICQGSMADRMAEQLFIDTLGASKRLALAFEALSTFMYLALYTPISTKDAAVNVGDDPKYALASFIDDRLVPRRYLGFGVVMGILACHVLLLVGISGVFVRSSGIALIQDVPDNNE